MSITWLLFCLVTLLGKAKSFVDPNKYKCASPLTLFGTGLETNSRHCGALIGTTDDAIAEEDLQKLEPYVHDATMEQSESINLKHLRNGNTLRRDANTLRNEVFESRRLTCTRCTKRLGWKYQSECKEKVVDAALETAKDKETEVEKRTLQWALSTLEGRCLYKTVDGASYRYCHEVSVVKKGKRKEIVLGIFDGDGTRAEREKENQVQFGELAYNYVPFKFGGGTLCTARPRKKYESKVLFLCCDSYSEGDTKSIQQEGDNLRIELVLPKEDCYYELFICVPRLCFLPGYEHPETLANEAAAASELVPTPSSQSQQNACDFPSFYSLFLENVLVESSTEYVWIAALRADSLTI